MRRDSADVYDSNMSGLLAGAVVGNRLGAVRDKKGKAVYQVFQEMPQGDRMKVRSQPTWYTVYSGSDD